MDPEEIARRIAARRLFDDEPLPYNLYDNHDPDVPLLLQIDAPTVEQEINENLDQVKTRTEAMDDRLGSLEDEHEMVAGNIANIHRRLNYMRDIVNSLSDRMRGLCARRRVS